MKAPFVNPSLKWQDKLFYMSVCLLVVSFPFSIAVNSISLALVLLFFLLDYRQLKTNLTNYFNSSRNIILLSLFILLLISLAYSTDQHQGVGKIIGYLPMLTLPLSLTKLNHIPQRWIHFLLKLHIFSCLAASVYCLLKVVVDSGLIDGSYKTAVAPNLYLAYFVHRFTYHQLSEKLHLHAVYFSFFIAVGQFYLLFLTTPSLRKINGEKLLFLFFCGMLLLLKSVVLNFAFYSFLLYYFYRTLSFKKLKHHLAFYSLSIFSSALVFYLFLLKNVGSFAQNIYLFDNAAWNHRFFLAIITTLATAVISVVLKLVLSKRALTWLIIFGTCASFFLAAAVYLKKSGEAFAGKEKTEGINNVDARSGSWQSAWLLIKEHPLFGIGVGDTEKALMEKYRQINFEAGLQNQFNVHNQYLEFWLAGGLFTLLCFLLLLFGEAYRAFREKNFMLLGFLYLFIAFCFTESVINRQAGRAFFLLFLCLLGSHVFRNSTSIRKS